MSLVCPSKTLNCLELHVSVHAAVNPVTEQRVSLIVLINLSQRGLILIDVHCDPAENKTCREADMFVSLQCLNSLCPLERKKRLQQSSIYKAITCPRVSKRPLYDLSAVWARL